MPWTHKVVPAILIVAFAAVGTVHAASLHVRLLTSLSSRSSHDGEDFEAVVTSDWPRQSDSVNLPAQTIIRGKVMRARAVGLGLRRDHSVLELGFAEYELPDGRRYPLWAQLQNVDNARESVRKGQIQGALAAAGPGGWIQGLWLRPQLGLVTRTFSGLAGLSGMISSSLPFGPLGDVTLLAARTLIFRLPDTDIQLPAGTDLFVRVSHLATGAPEFPRSVNEAPDAVEATWIAGMDPFITERDGKGVFDRMNIAVEGTLDEVQAAFLSAGWAQADPLSRESFGKAYKAFVSMTGYSSAPVSPLAYQGWLPDMVFEKGLNTLAKRHHIRLWHAGTYEGRDIWLGAASHDVVMSLKKWPVTLTHKIDPNIDRERERVAEDLLFAGCASSEGYVEREGLASGGKRNTQTDGRLLILRSAPCDLSRKQSNDIADLTYPKSPVMQRTVRRFILESRYHFLQGSIYFQGASLLFRRHQAVGND